MLFSQFKKYCSILLLLFLLISCVKDTDFDQTEDFLITPVVELNLIFFDLDASNFIDEGINNSMLIVRDTTVIDFLDDAEVQDAVKRIEFYFEFTNSIPRAFDINFDFLASNDDLNYSMNTTVAAGSSVMPVETIYVENIEGQEIEDLTKSNKVVVSASISSSDRDLEGTLRLRSKTTYFVEIDD